MHKCTTLLFTLGTLAFSGTAFVDNLPKCSIKDNECMKKLYQSIIHDAGEKGIPELNIQPFDPYAMKNISMLIDNILDITLVDGVALGVKDCVFHKFSVDIIAEKGSQEIICDITVKGRYKVVSSSPFIKYILGGNTINGEGNGKVEIKKLHLSMDYQFYAQKHDDGEIYIKCLCDDFKFNYDIKGKTTFFADNLFMGDQDVAKPVLQILNENEKFVMKNFGRPFIAKAMEIFRMFISSFFDYVPVKYYLTDNFEDIAKS